jgi:hypothetical protein
MLGETSRAHGPVVVLAEVRQGDGAREETRSEQKIAHIAFAFALEVGNV